MSKTSCRPYVQGIASNGSKSHRTIFPYRFQVVDSADIMPLRCGGHVVHQPGLLIYLNSEAQAMGRRLLGHEIGHVQPAGGLRQQSIAIAQPA